MDDVHPYVDDLLGHGNRARLLWAIQMVAAKRAIKLVHTQELEFLGIKLGTIAK